MGFEGHASGLLQAGGLEELQRGIGLDLGVLEIAKNGTQTWSIVIKVHAFHVGGVGKNMSFDVPCEQQLENFANNLVL